LKINGNVQNLGTTLKSYDVTKVEMPFFLLGGTSSPDGFVGQHNFRFNSTLNHAELLSQFQDNFFYPLDLVAANIKLKSTNGQVAIEQFSDKSMSVIVTQNS